MLTRGMPAPLQLAFLLNDTNSAEMEKGIEGVKLALKVLNEYYSKEGKAHGSADGAGSGIIGLLEVKDRTVFYAFRCCLGTFSSFHGLCSKQD